MTTEVFSLLVGLVVAQTVFLFGLRVILREHREEMRKQDAK